MFCDPRQGERIAPGLGKLREGCMAKHVRVERCQLPRTGLFSLGVNSLDRFRMLILWVSLLK